MEALNWQGGLVVVSETALFNLPDFEGGWHTFAVASSSGSLALFS